MAEDRGVDPEGSVEDRGVDPEGVNIGGNGPNENGENDVEPENAETQIPEEFRANTQHTRMDGVDAILKKVHPTTLKQYRGKMEIWKETR